EHSLLAAEVVAAAGEQTEVRQFAELVYPEGASPAEPAALGKALAQFLRENNFTARATVVGLPARWVLVKSKEVPPADASTLAELLLLQAESEFSSEFKDLVYEYAGDAGAGPLGTVILIATP